jgi:large subunit ribosomal protein L17
MRHGRRKKKLGVTTNHRKALLRNLVRNLVLYRRIRTTVARAKSASAFSDKLITIAKRGDLHARRTLVSYLGCPETADRLITKIAPHFKERQGYGGYGSSGVDGAD